MSSLTAPEKLDLLRHKHRPTVRDYLPLLLDDFLPLHGDRLYGDDPAILGGIGTLAGVPVTLLAHVKGRNLEENKAVNFAMPHPEGYRKALRLAKQAEKFYRPIICLIDTPGAFCGIAAEERGQGEAIAKNLLEFSRLQTPIVSVVLGEGGSGGALALGVCDHLAMLEHALYSVISPRGFASILWKDASKEKEAASIMKITAQDLLDLGVADTIIKEPPGGAHNNLALTAELISDALQKIVGDLLHQPLDLLLENRYNKFRKIGSFSE